MKKVFNSCCGCMVIIIGGIFLLHLGLYVYSEWIWEEWPTDRIERVTGVRVPEYKVIEDLKGKRSFTGDYEDRYEIEFKTIPSDGIV